MDGQHEFEDRLEEHCAWVTERIAQPESAFVGLQRSEHDFEAVERVVRATNEEIVG